MYFETLEPPTRNWLEGLDNVILNLAVWRHCYFHKMDDPECRLPGWIPDYRHNASHDVPHDKRIINYDHYLAYEGWRKVVGNGLKCLIFDWGICPLSQKRLEKLVFSHYFIVHHKQKKKGKHRGIKYTVKP